MTGRGITLSVEVTFVTEECCNCGMAFAMTSDFRERRRADHGWFYCPAGHQQRYTGETAEEALRRERDRLKQQVARADDEAQSARAEAATLRKEVARQKKRAAAGLCPCCNRPFVALARHIATKHPDFSPKPKLIAHAVKP